MRKQISVCMLLIVAFVFVALLTFVLVNNNKTKLINTDNPVRAAGQEIERHSVHGTMQDSIVQEVSFGDEGGRAKSSHVASTVESTTLDPPSAPPTTFHEMEKVVWHRDVQSPASVQPAVQWITKDASQVVLPSAPSDSARDWFFGWVHIDPEQWSTNAEASLESLDVVLLPGIGDLRRARLPRSDKLLRQIVARSEIVGIGTMPTDQKIEEGFLPNRPTNDVLKASITLMTNQDTSPYRKILQQMGINELAWDPTIRVLSCDIPLDQVELIAKLDFVQQIDRMGKITAMLDSSMSVAGVDSVREYAGSAGGYTGLTGAGIPIGVVDTGLNVAHRDISTNRSSVCGESFVTLDDGTVDTEDLWTDYHGHGTHVAGILLGNGFNEQNLAGAAPGITDIRFAKALTKEDGIAHSYQTHAAMDYLATESSCEWQGSKSKAIRPLIVNLSLGLNSSGSGRDVGARKLDYSVWTHRQLYVVAQGNEGSQSLTNYAGAKNSLAVGNLVDTGLAATWSSWGPTGDGRLAPNIAAPGTYVKSVEGAGSRSGYATKSGTSMSAPAVTGIAALLMEAAPEFKNNPALVRAHLMATAIKPDRFLHSESWFPRNNSSGPGIFSRLHGLGVVSARTALTQQADGWANGSAVEDLENDEYAYIVVDVPANTERLDIVLTWDEPPSDTSPGTTVVADIDLYFGPNSNCDPTECAEYSSKSRIDNVEYLVIENPKEGRQRISIVPYNVYRHQPRAAIAWQAITGKSTPTVTMTTDKTVLDFRSTTSPQLEVSLEADSYVASSTTLSIACRPNSVDDCDWIHELVWQNGSRVEREDGTFQDLAGKSVSNQVHVGELGQIARTVTLVFPPGLKTSDHRLVLQAVAANANSASTVLDVTVDNNGSLPVVASVVPNDNFTDAQELIGASGQTTVDLISATREPGENFLDWSLFERYFDSPIPELFGEGQIWSTRTAWFFVESDTFARMHLTISDKIPNSNSIIHVITFPDQNLLDRNWVANDARDQELFVMRPNQKYYIRVVAFSFVPSSFTLRWNKLHAIPDNDQFANRTRISGADGSEIENNLFATMERGEPAGAVANASTWYTWTAPDDPNYDAWEFSVDSEEDTGHNILVYEGDSLNELRLVSDPTAQDVVVPITEGTTYQIAVATRWNDSPGKYTLRWDSSSASSFADNDLYEDSEEIGEESGTVEARLSYSIWSENNSDQRTVESGEPHRTASHSQWWNWTAPTDGRFTWRLTQGVRNVLSFFEGTSLDELKHIVTGTEIVIDAEADKVYSIALHRRKAHTYSTIRSTRKFEWGDTPANDRISAASGLEGSSGSTTFSLKFATSTLDETATQGLYSFGVKSSVWASWTPPDEFDDWMAFHIDTVEDKDLESRTHQYFLGIHEWNDQDGNYELISSTDRTYISSGIPVAHFKPDPGAEYLIQVALRGGISYSSDQSDVTVNWEPSDPPAWLTVANRAVDFGSSDGSDLEELFDPKAMVAIESEKFTAPRLLLQVDAGLLVLGLDESERFVVEEVIDGKDADGEALSDVVSIGMRWDQHRQAVYFARRNGLGLLEGLNQWDRHRSLCSPENDFSFSTAPLDLVFDPTGKYVYKVGNGLLAMYRMDAPCMLTPLAAVSARSISHELGSRERSLDGLNSVAISKDGGFLYGMNEDSDLLVFEVDHEEETFSLTETQSHSDWRGDLDLRYPYRWYFDSAMTLVDSSGKYLFAVGTRNPTVVVFDIGTEPDSPIALGGTDEYYIGTHGTHTHFPSHIKKPRGDLGEYWNRGDCQVAGLHGSNHVAIDVLCNDRYFVATWDTDEEILLLSDWSTDKQPDRFGNHLPDMEFLSHASSTVSWDGRYAYLVVNDWIDSIHQFKRVSGPSVVTDTVEPFDEYIVRLVAIEVSPGSVSLGSQSYADCETFTDFAIGGTSFTVESSKWQTRTEPGADWSDVEGTVQESQLCPFNPSDNQEHRMAMEASIDGVSGKYSSNIMSVPEEQ